MAQKTASYILKWGILSTGVIASRFAKDLLKDANARGSSDVQHQISAVASRTLDKAQTFIEEHLADKAATKIRPLQSYEDMYNDPDIDVIYVGTPHSHHYRNAKDALHAGKAVLLEKPSTVTAEQLIELVDTARRKKLFFMEAVWTRYFPIMYDIQNRIHSGEIGKIKFVEAQFCSLWKDSIDAPTNDRMFTPKLAGGSILDQGPYPWTWIAMTLHHPQPGSYANQDFSVPKDLKGNQILSSNTPGEMIDESTVATWTHNNALAVFKTSMCAAASNAIGVLITGTTGQIVVDIPPYRPTGFTIRKWKDEFHQRDSPKKPETEEYIAQDFPDNIWGLAWEADEVARCIRDGKLESERMPLDESIQMMKVFDEIRKQGGLKYPEEIEIVDSKECKALL